MKSRFFAHELTPLHVVGTCYQEKWPVAKLYHAWDFFGQALAGLHAEYAIKTHAFVMMNNHYHWLCTLEGYPDQAWVFEWFHKRVSLEFLYRLQAFAGKIFKGAPAVFPLTHIKAYQMAYRYVYRNPVEAGLVEKPEIYPFSTLPYVLGADGLAFDCHDNMNLIMDPFRTLQWLGQPLEEAIDGFWH